MTDYRVNDIYPTLQAEGVNCGLPMMLVRLMGCPVGCPWCDTKETWDAQDAHYRPTVEEVLSGEFGQVTPYWTYMSPWDVALWVSEHPEGIRWVMLTGGEPAEQDTRALVAALHRAGKKVALETSGTATGHLSPNSRDATCDWVCVSPKWQIPGSPHRPIIPEAVLSADELKFPVGRREDVEKVHRFLDTFAYRPDCEVCLQPLSMSKKATDLVLEVCQQEGWRASIQVHKYLRLK